MQNFRPLFLTISPVVVMGLVRNWKCIILDFCKKEKNITAAEKIWSKSHCVYPHKIMQTSSLGRQQKYSVEHNDCFYVVSILQWRIRKNPTDNIIILQNCFQINCQIITPMLIKSIATTLRQYVFWIKFCWLETLFCRPS